ncbi:hypothetical protein GGR50DRAFT_651263 [Xylaria sp. CBS 124048]|nr:hypothetical protein GGR50DRAFT_651263 [Xylaria sp. CBS 124048]
MCLERKCGDMTLPPHVTVIVIVIVMLCCCFFSFFCFFCFLLPLLLRLFFFLTRPSPPLPSILISYQYPRNKPEVPAGKQEKKKKDIMSWSIHTKCASPNQMIPYTHGDPSKSLALPSPSPPLAPRLDFEKKRKRSLYRNQPRFLYPFFLTLL